MTTEVNHLAKIRERFTATADVFTEYVRTIRVEESESLAERATAGLAIVSEALAIDVACGPGTFTRPFAPRVGRAVGVDLTPAMIEKARAEAERAGITNIEFVCGNIYALPFADGVAGIVACGYAFHHMLEPARALMEMARVLRPGGRVAIADIIVSEGPGDAIYVQVRRMLEEIMTDDTSGLNPRRSEKTGGLEFLHTVLLLVAEKPE